MLPDSTVSCSNLVVVDVLHEEAIGLAVRQFGIT